MTGNARRILELLRRRGHASAAEIIGITLVRADLERALEELVALGRIELIHYTGNGVKIPGARAIYRDALEESKATAEHHRRRRLADERFHDWLKARTPKGPRP
jgi:hypothetical protein